MKFIFNFHPSLAYVLTVILSLVCISSIAFAAEPVKKSRFPNAEVSFLDEFSTFNPKRWTKADGWKNGVPFDNGWRAENITFSNGEMDIRLDDQPFKGQPFSSGHYQTLGFYGYGCYEASFKPIASAGVISSFFTFAGPYDNGGNGQHNEIDIEFLGNNTTRFQANFWTNDDSYIGEHEYMVDLGFDASIEFHCYGFKWTSGKIQWFVDGTLVYEVNDTASDPTPKVGESLQKIMMNVWPVDETAASWAGQFAYPGTPLHGHYNWIRYIAGEDCNLSGASRHDPVVIQPTFISQKSQYK